MLLVTAPQAKDGDKDNETHLYLSDTEHLLNAITGASCIVYAHNERKNAFV